MTDLSLNILGKLMNSIPLLTNNNFDEMPNMINFGDYIWPRSMWSVTPGKKCCIISR